MLNRTDTDHHALRDPDRPSTLASPLSAVACVMGMLLVVLGQLLGTADVPRQYYPVMTLHADITVTPTEVIVRDEPKGLPDPSEHLGPLRNSDTMRVSAFARHYRAVPLRSRGRSGYVEYSPNYNQPRWEELQQAGPERGVELHMASHRFTAEGFTRLIYPHEPDRPAPFGEMKPMEDETVRRILPAFADWIYEMSGDQGFADGVRAGGMPMLPLPAPRFHRLMLWLTSIGGGLLLLGIVSFALAKARAASAAA